MIASASEDRGVKLVSTETGDPSKDQPPGDYMHEFVWVAVYGTAGLVEPARR